MFCKVLSLSDTAIVLDKASYETFLISNLRNIALLINPIAPRVLEIIDNNTKRTLLFVGHCVPTRGIFELVKACKIIPNIKLDIVGNISDNIKRDLHNKTNNAEWLDIT